MPQEAPEAVNAPPVAPNPPHKHSGTPKKVCPHAPFITLSGRLSEGPTPRIAVPQPEQVRGSPVEFVIETQFSAENRTYSVEG